MRSFSPRGRFSGKSWLAGAALLGGLSSDEMSQEEQPAWHGTDYAAPERQVGGIRKQEAANSFEILRFEQRWREVGIDQLNEGFESLLTRIEKTHRDAASQRGEGADLDDLARAISELQDLINRAYGLTYARSETTTNQGDEARLAACHELEDFSAKRQQFTQHVLRKMLNMGALDDEMYGLTIQALRDTWGADHFAPVRFNE